MLIVMARTVAWYSAIIYVTKSRKGWTLERVETVMRLISSGTMRYRKESDALRLLIDSKMCKLHEKHYRMALKSGQGE